MAIAENDLIESFGTETEVTTGPAEVTDGNYSTADDMSEWTNADDAPHAMFRFVLTTAGLGAAPAGNCTLYARCMNIDGATDSVIPSDESPHLRIGTLVVNRVDADQENIHGPFKLPNYKTSSVFEFYIKNDMGTTTGTGWELHVIPVTVGPHPA